ncbi:pyruvate, water dikinase regulatory protein [Anaerosporomusa subterranea]|uniref:pyruvate, water dikinase regulatory protein n=1 Tax=Anaerosporomusa subterranea TaxID=1794912 RepID=UPI0009EE59FE|nr:pyruvate, water dikinase regulatory protein [Anaerosporomusa subterranea]
MKNTPIIYVVSDSIGQTGEVVVKAAASQFNSGNVDIRRVPYIRTVEEAAEAIVEAQEAGGAIIYTIVSPELRLFLATKSKEHGVTAVDVMGPVMDAIRTVTPDKPKLEPGLARRLDKAYFNKIEAIDFAVKYDDGKQQRGLLKADIVIIGVSRSTKTPLSMFLATRGFKTANVPLVPEVAPPDEIFKMPIHRIVGLMMQPSLLYEIRKERLKTMGLSTAVDYANLERILEELDYASKIMRRVGCAVIDVTNRAVEETAAKVEEIYRKGVGK